MGPSSEHNNKLAKMLRGLWEQVLICGNLTPSWVFNLKIFYFRQFHSLSHFLAVESICMRGLKRVPKSKKGTYDATPSRTKTCAQLCSSITLFAQALILAPRLFASSPNWAPSPPWLWNCQVAFRKTTAGGDFERCSQILLPIPWVSRLNQDDGGGGGEMIQRCGEKVKKQAVERTIQPLEVYHSLFPIPDPSSCHTVPTSRTWSCSCHRGSLSQLNPSPTPNPSSSPPLTPLISPESPQSHNLGPSHFTCWRC